MDNIKKDDDDGDSESDDDLDEDGNIKNDQHKKLFNIFKSIHSLTNERRSQRSSKKATKDRSTK